jgi:hypothetical protein
LLIDFGPSKWKEGQAMVDTTQTTACPDPIPSTGRNFLAFMKRAV